MNTERISVSEHTFCTTTTVEELIGGIPAQRVKGGIDTYLELPRKPLKITYGTHFGPTNDSVLVHFPDLNGYELAALRHFAAPSKVYADEFDMRDTNDDWIRLFRERNVSDVNRLEAHRRIPNWNLFEKSWEEILQFMNEGMVSWSQNSLEKAAHFQPVACFSKDKQGGWTWDVETASHILPKWSWLATLFVAGYAPEITIKWGPNSDYRGRTSLNMTESTQDMGPTQAIPLALWKRNELLGSKLVKKILEVSGK